LYVDDVVAGVVKKSYFRERYHLSYVSLQRYGDSPNPYIEMLFYKNNNIIIRFPRDI
jgi:hypothetical protein